MLVTQLREVKHLPRGHRAGEWTSCDSKSASQPGGGPLCFTSSQKKAWDDGVTFQLFFHGNPAEMFYFISVYFILVLTL